MEKSMLKKIGTVVLVVGIAALVLGIVAAVTIGTVLVKVLLCSSIIINSVGITMLTYKR